MCQPSFLIAFEGSGLQPSDRTRTRCIAIPAVVLAALCRRARTNPFPPQYPAVIAGLFEVHLVAPRPVLLHVDEDASQAGGQKPVFQSESKNLIPPLRSLAVTLFFSTSCQTSAISSAGGAFACGSACLNFFKHSATSLSVIFIVVLACLCSLCVTRSYLFSEFPFLRVLPLLIGLESFKALIKHPVDVSTLATRDEFEESPVVVSGCTLLAAQFSVAGYRLR